MADQGDRFERELRELVDRYRIQCLWFLREDYYPGDDAARLRVLDYIQRHGDLEAFRLAGKLRTWLLRNSKDASAD